MRLVDLVELVKLVKLIKNSVARENSHVKVTRNLWKPVSLVIPVFSNSEPGRDCRRVCGAAIYRGVLMKLGVLPTGLPVNIRPR